MDKEIEEIAGELEDVDIEKPETEEAETPEPEEAEPEHDPEEAETPEPEEEEDPKEEYSARVQKRIEQLTAARREEERRRLALEKKLEKLNEQMDGFTRQSTERSEQELDERYSKLQSKLADAIEAGDTGAQVKLQDAMIDLNTERKLNTLRRRAAEEQAQQQSTQSSQPPELALRWAEKNKWYGDPRYQEQSQYALFIDQQLDRAGYDKNSQEYYDELDRRLQKIHPELYSKPVKKRKTGSPVGGTSKPGVKGKSAVKLTDQDFTTMREFGITTKEQIAEYVAEKKKRIMENG